jgi:hypothetical protein
MADGPERPVIEQDNDVDTPFAISVPQGIPQHLQDLIQYQSTDPDAEVIEQVNSEITVDADKVAEENPQSRFRILDVAIQKPGICFVCKDSGGDGRQFVDFNQTIEWYGVVYICTACVSEIAKLIGFATYLKYEELFKKYEKALLDLGNANLEVQYVRERLDAANLLLRDHLNGDCGPSGPDLEIAEADVIEPESDGDGSESSDRNESDADESDSVEGSDDISGSTGDDGGASKPTVRRTRKSAG